MTQPATQVDERRRRQRDVGGVRAMTATRHPRRERFLLDVSAACSARLCYLSVLEGETLRRDGVDAWRTLLLVHRAEKAHLQHRIDKATRLAVRLDYTPTERRDRDEEEAADRSDQGAFGLRDGERETPEWESAR